jgi:hypothetical protein
VIILIVQIWAEFCLNPPQQPSHTSYINKLPTDALFSKQSRQTADFSFPNSHYLDVTLALATLPLYK